MNAGFAVAVLYGEDIVAVNNVDFAVVAYDEPRVVAHLAVFVVADLDVEVALRVHPNLFIATFVLKLYLVLAAVGGRGIFRIGVRTGFANRGGFPGRDRLVV